ncbi:hypothetical protein A8A54_09955 [Brucella pseudogrignonensis]|uniref:hypothetical protein n=1 Tax=Brucella pseudogrignonensis TaxID=419475 RepID=UPI0007DA7DD5|nr:hypothetical protein [Brucella pseudogrignonensis]ANG96764.1 hypothetical protein A8A54_09955 [Brucella pseudogrignonensis]
MENHGYYILGADLVQPSYQSILSWMSDSANFLTLAQLFAALITAAATIALWRVTRVLAVETKTLAKMTAQPFIVCSLRSSAADATALDLIIQNTGNAVAFNIKVVITPPLPAYNGSTSDEITETVIEISMLPPSLNFQKQGVMGRYVHDKTFAAHIEWASLPQGSQIESLDYQFKADDGFRGGWNVKGMHQLVEEVAKIRNKIS